jgi:hypothetical protein
MEHAFARPLPSPPRVAFDYRTAGRTAEIWGWRFAIDHPHREFTYLTNVSRQGLTITGHGRLAVTTAPLYRGLRAYVITIQGAPPRRVRADPYRRLQFTVEVGQPRTVTLRRTASDRPPPSSSTTTVHISAAKAN